MMFIHPASVLGLLLGSAFAASEEKSEYAGSSVIQLTTTTFPGIVDSADAAMVKYYAPWCGHCKKMVPVYSEVAEHFGKESPSKIKICSVNCVDNEKLCSDKGIKGYPTIKVYKNGVESDYSGGRDKDSIIRFMNKQLMPTITTLTAKNYMDFTTSENVVIVGSFAENSKEMATFKSVAEQLHNDFTFGALPTGVLADGVHLYKKFDEAYVKFTGTALDKDEVIRFIKKESTPLMGVISPENYAGYVEAGLPMLYLFAENSEQRSKYGPMVEDAVRQLKGKINAVHIDATKFDRHAEALNLPKKWPGVVVHDMEHDLKYPYAGEITAETMAKFAKDYVAGKLEPSYRSEDVPTKNDGPVKIVVFKTFETIVNDPKKDVLLEIYAPWCGACKRAEPIYNKVAELYNGSDIVLAKIDGTANDVLGFKLTKFPTFLLYKADASKKSEPIEFEGGLDSANTLINFIKEHAVNKVEVTAEDDEKADL